MFKSLTLQITTSATYFTVHFPSQVRHANMAVDNQIRKFLKAELTVMKFNNRWRRWEVQYTYYLSTSQWYRLPIAYLDKFVEYMNLQSIGISISKENPTPAIPLGVKPMQGWEPRDNQHEPLEFLSDSNKTQAALSLATGNGKTFTAIRSAINLDNVTIILCTGLIEVWYNSLLEQTQCEKDDIWVMQGFSKVDTLYNMAKEGYRPRFIIASLPTVHSFIMRKKAFEYTDYTFSELVTLLGIGTKIIDECHQRLSQMVTVDLVCNVQNNIYLSATYLATDKVIKRIFNVIFNNDIKHVGVGNAKHCNIETYFYHILVNEKKCTNVNGYSHASYEKQLLDQKTLWNNFEDGVLQPIINSRFISDRKPWQRGLIFCSTHDMCGRVVESLKAYYPELNIGQYCSSKGDNIDATLYNDDIDLCVTTYGSSGTGKDIGNLWFVLNTTSFSSDLMGIQMQGRLRKLPGEETRFIDISNSYMDSHIRHQAVRENIWKELGLTYTDFNIP